MCRCNVGCLCCVYYSLAHTMTPWPTSLLNVTVGRCIRRLADSIENETFEQAVDGRGGKSLMDAVDGAAAAAAAAVTTAGASDTISITSSDISSMSASAIGSICTCIAVPFNALCAAL